MFNDLKHYQKAFYNMSLAKITDEINRFLNSKTPEVLALKGAWGVGKTYTWNMLLQEAKNQKKLKLEKYSYVSLFGINSLDALKNEIYLQETYKDLIGTPFSIETIKTKFEALYKTYWKKIASVFTNIPIFNKGLPSGLADSLLYFSIRTSLIVLDDIDRVGKDLEPDLILGIVSQLKEQRDCKIVLIFNEEALTGTFAETYRKFREKVIDIEINFDPTAEECADIVFKNDDPHINNIKTFISKLDINNIRILKKIDSLWKKLSPHLSEYDSEIINQACQTLTLLTWCFYCTGDNKVPDFCFVKNIGTNIFYQPDLETEKGKQEASWQTLLREYNFTDTDKFDLVLADFVEKGWIDKDALTLQAKNLQGELEIAKSQDSFKKAWDFYLDSFDNNEEEVVNLIFESFKINIQTISVLSLHSTVWLFRELDRDNLADEIINLFIEHFKDSFGVFDLGNDPIYSEVTDTTLIESFNRQLKKSYKNKTIEEVLSNITQGNRGSRRDELILSSTSEDDYYNLFKRVKGETLKSYINTLLSFGRIEDSNECRKTTLTAVTGALERISKESKINSLRIRQQYGLTFQDNNKKEG